MTCPRTVGVVVRLFEEAGVVVVTLRCAGKLQIRRIVITVTCGKMLLYILFLGLSLQKLLQKWSSWL